MSKFWTLRQAKGYWKPILNLINIQEPKWQYKMVYILISKRGDCTVIFLPYANAVSSDNENAVNHGMRQITYVQTRTVIFSFNYLSVSFNKKCIPQCTRRKASICTFLQLLQIIWIFTVSRGVARTVVLCRRLY